MNTQRTWFFEGVETVVVEGYPFPNIVCGAIYDLNAGSVGGHCVIALTQERIQGVDDLGLLEGAPMIEPQNGMYLGSLDDSSSGVFLLPEGKDAPSYIFEVITDDDLFLFSDRFGEWQSYSGFLDELEEAEAAMLETSS